MTPLPVDLPTVPASQLLGDAPILVLAPHPDDESLGCGALLTAAFAGHGAHIVCMTDGSRSHPGSREWPGPRMACLRRTELTEAVRRLGGSEADVTWLGLPDGAAGAADPARVAESIAGIASRTGARTLFSASDIDHHADHKATARIARLLRDREPGMRLFLYPVWSRWDEDDAIALHSPLTPLRLWGAGARDTKANAIRAHRSQLGEVVTDDKDGFAMEPGFVDMFIASDEIYFEVPQ